MNESNPVEYMNAPDRDQRSVRGWQSAVALPVILILLLAVLCLSFVWGFSQTISLPRNFSQAYRDPSGYWGDSQMGTDGCPDRIAAAGCLVAAFATVLDYYDVRLSIPAVSSSIGIARTGMDPGILNDWLRTHGGYGACSQDPYGNCCLEWTELPWQISLSFHENRSESGIDAVARQIIDDALRSGYPVVAGVHWGASCHGTTTRNEDCHWVVIIGKFGQSYEIIDPYNSDSSRQEGIRTTLSRGVFGSYIIDRYVVVAGSAPASRLAKVNLVSSFKPGGLLYPGETIQGLLKIEGTRSPLLLYARVTDPRGRVSYAYYGSPSSTILSYTQQKRSLYLEPRWFTAHEWEWTRAIVNDGQLGTWTWELWVEDVARPGLRLGYDISAYTVAEEGTEAFQPAISVLLAVGMTAMIITLIYVLGMAINNG